MRLALPAFMAMFMATGVLVAQDVTPNTDGKVPYTVGKGSRLVRPDEVEIVEKSLDYDANIAAPADPGGDSANGAKFYCFVLKPKEKLLVRLKAENSNRVGMMAVPPAKQDKMVSQYERSARVPKALRSSRFEIQNILDEPYTLVLMTYGSVNYSYKLTIERKM